LGFSVTKSVGNELFFGENLVSNCVMNKNGILAIIKFFHLERKTTTEIQLRLDTVLEIHFHFPSILSFEF